MSNDLQPAANRGRLESLDALRGFTMFWIVGGSTVVHALLARSENVWLVALDSQFKHFDWEGFCFFDLIMPLFLFMIGVSIYKPIEAAAATLCLWLVLYWLYRTKTFIRI